MTDQDVSEPTISELENEGDIAADFIEGLLDIADIDGDLTLDVKQGRAYVSVEAEGEDSLRLLSAPDTVQALQELTRLAVQNSTGSFSRLILDVAGSRDARRTAARASDRLGGGAARRGGLPGIAPIDVELRAEARA